MYNSFLLQTTDEQTEEDRVQDELLKLDEVFGAMDLQDTMEEIWLVRGISRRDEMSRGSDLWL